jgi:nicotinamidase-related amidase
MLMSADRCGLLVIDMQERLLPAVEDAARITANTVILLDAAARLGVPALASEQYPEGLGGSVPDVAERLPAGATLAKTEFSCMTNAAYAKRLRELVRPQAVVAGAEAHVCVLQTVAGLIGEGLEVFVVEDAIGSRRRESKRAAIERMRAWGASVVTTEMVVFEWMGRSDIPAFRELSALIK